MRKIFATPAPHCRLQDLEKAVYLLHPAHPPRGAAPRLCDRASDRNHIPSGQRFGRLLPEVISVASSVEEKVIGIVSEQLGVPREEVSRQSSFVDDLKADSLDVVELVMEFEDEFNVTIPDDDYEKIKTVGDAIDYIEERL
jgi:acyl carrier protein